MSKSFTIKTDQFEATINNILAGYSAESIEKMKKATQKAAKFGKATVKDKAKTISVGSGDYAHTGLVKTGKYANSWEYKKVDETALTIEYNVYSKKYYMLTHLLEFGHEKVLWGMVMAGQRVRGYPHIAPAEKETADKFQQFVLTEMERYDGI